MDFELADAGDAIVLTLAAPKGGEPAMHMLAELSPPPSPRSPRELRLTPRR
jgi:hypothetical protein